MKSTLSIIMLLSIITCFGQRSLSVIPKNGASLRAEPNVHSEIIKSIPFLGKVKSIEPMSSHPTPGDTLSVYFVRTDRNEAHKRYIVGNWRQVIHKKDTGYVNNAYLCWLDDSPSDSLNVNYGITVPGTNCFDNVHRNKFIEWKGLFKTTAGYEIRDIQLDYYNTQSEMVWFGIRVDDTKDLILCLGSDNDTFFNGSVKGKYFKNGQIFEYSKEPTINSKYDFFEVRTIDKRPTLFLKDGDKRQRLLAASPMYLDWKGDLDYDGKDDYIISAGEKSSGRFLYLSSEAGPDQIVKLVAVYSTGYCC